MAWYEKQVTEQKYDKPFEVPNFQQLGKDVGQQFLDIKAKNQLADAYNRTNTVDTSTLEKEIWTLENELRQLESDYTKQIDIDNQAKVMQAKQQQQMNPVSQVTTEGTQFPMFGGNRSPVNVNPGYAGSGMAPYAPSVPNSPMQPAPRPAPTNWMDGLNFPSYLPNPRGR